ncbi:hypothetical protein EPUS_08378 [Endocarpon pusillum Z07020]|uniref:Uncharacterized protein n=1 Tax=Endocarpon pusillum (strain Z07020 / HMAS-L-300199) TaxID=1263415 RepID=U1GAI6_ENDPU|nr:uncharacterized protein EPUS_08378 [Endocarpon pusillum Z07020]ERF69028.1 hypothetical protein EPUS_08378 [Endocarpon pusillum Z07020]
MVVNHSPKLAEEIKTTVIEKSDGMFFLAKMHMDEIVKTRTARAVYSALHSLPSGCNDYFQETLKRIETQGDIDRNLACRVWSWVAYTTRKLTIPEIEQALAVEKGDTCLNKDGYINPDLAVETCAGLVVLGNKLEGLQLPEGQDPRGLELVHASAKDFFQQLPDEEVRRAHSRIAQDCLTYLTFEDFATGVCQTGYEVWYRLKQYPFMWYAAHHWAMHFTKSQDPELVGLVLTLLKQSNKVAALTQFLIQPEEAMRLDSKYWSSFQNSPSSVSGLHIAAYLGLAEVIRTLLRQGISHSVRDSEGSSALHWAVRGSQKQTIQLLLEEGIDKDSADDKGNTTLFLALKSRDEEVVANLVHCGADVKGQGGCPNKALALAAEENLSDSFCLLQEAGARIWSDDSNVELTEEELEAPNTKVLENICTWKMKRALHQTLTKELRFAHSDSEEFLSALWPPEASNPKSRELDLLRGASEATSTFDHVESTNRKADSTPLFFAIDQFSKSEWLEKEYVFFCAAASAGHQQLCRWLLQRGKPSACSLRRIDLRTWTALHHASATSHIAFQLLLQNGGNPFAYSNGGDSGYGNSILHIAASKGPLSVIEAAIRVGIDVNVRRVTGLQINWVEYCHTPLNEAIPDQNKVKFLLQQGADVHLRGDGRATVLHFATQHPLSQLELFELFIDLGVNVNARDSYGRTALFIAATRRTEIAIDALVRGGADASIPKSNGMTPLYSLLDGWDPSELSKERMCGMVENLLKARADAKSAESCYPCNSILHKAAYAGAHSVVQLLLDAGADPAAENSLKKTPLDTVLMRLDKLDDNDPPSLKLGLAATYRLLSERTSKSRMDELGGLLSDILHLSSQSTGGGNYNRTGAS